jgi:hypothetical protein
MNRHRHHRRAEAARGRKPVDRAEVIRLRLPCQYCRADRHGCDRVHAGWDARKLHGNTKPDGAT